MPSFRFRNQYGEDVYISAASGAGTSADPYVLALTDSGSSVSLAIIDDWDESDRAKVNLIVGAAGVAAGAGAVGATTQRATLASDDPAVVSLGVMDDWDESDRAKVNIIVGQAGVTAGAGVVAVNTPRTTLASDDPAVVSLAVIDDWDESDRAKVNPIVGSAGVAGGAGTVSASTQRIAIATDANVVDTELPAAAALADATANPTTPLAGGCVITFNGTTWDRGRSVINAMDSAGTGIQAVGVVGQFDDTSTGTVTENQFAPVRISSIRAMLTDPGKSDPLNDGVGAAQVNTQAVAVTTSGAYADGDVVGGILSLTTVNYASGRRVALRSVQINNKDGNAPELRVYFFKATPSGGTYTDNSALAWGSGDSANKVGQFKIATTDWLTDGSQSSVNVSNLGMKMTVSATTLFALIVIRTAVTLTNGQFTLQLDFDQE